MLARFTIALPFDLYMPADLLGALDFQTTQMAGMTIRLHPPFSSTLVASDLSPDTELTLAEVAKKLRYEPAPTPSQLVWVDGQATLRCDAIAIDFTKDSFDRAFGVDDPPAQLAFSLVNDWITRLRLLSQAAKIVPVVLDETIWHLQYLDDDENELEKDPEEKLHRDKWGVNFKLLTVPLIDEMWAATSALGWGHQASPAEHLLLDAAASLTEVGPALVLAATALETRIAQALDEISKLYGVPQDLWRWINGRDTLKSPTTEEQLDSLLYSITRRTLKEDSRLWEGFKNLRQARNRFVHGGLATIGNVQVDVARTGELISLAREIVDWVEQLLPPGSRRPYFARPVQVQLNRGIAPEGTDMTHATLKFGT